MCRGWWIAAAALCLAGCIPSAQELRIQEYSNDGVWLYQQGRYDLAADDFQAALTLKPNDADLLYNLGESERCRGGSAKAEKCFNQCLEQAPGHVHARFALAELLVEMGRSADATRLIEEWQNRQPESADVHALKGWYYHQAGDLPRAQASLQRALELEPHHHRALIELGLLYEAMQRPERAVALYERALNTDPDQPDVKRRWKALVAQGVSRPQPD